MIQHLEILIIVLSFNNWDNDHARDSFDKYYMPLVEIKDFNALIHSKPFFGLPVNNKQETFEKLGNYERNNDYTAGNISDYLYNQKHYKFIGINLWRQANVIDPQLVNFLGKLEEDGGVTMFFIVEKQQKNILNFSLDFLIVTE